MTPCTSPVLFVHTCNPKTRSSNLSKRSDANNNIEDKGKSQGNKEDEEEDEELARDVMRISKLSSLPYLVSPTEVKVQGSDTSILFHHGCVKSGSLVRCLGEKAWDELWRNGSFWLLSCYSPMESLASDSNELHRDVFGYSTQGSGDEFLLEYLVRRLFDASLTLTVVILQWTEEGNENSQQSLNKLGGEFNDSKALIDFVQLAFEGIQRQSPFQFSLLSISFADPTSKRTCEMVLTSVSAHIAEMSSQTSSSLVAVRSWFSNISSIHMSRTREESMDDTVQRDLKAWAAPVVPPGLIEFLFTRIYRWRNEEALERVDPVLPHVVYTLLEVPPLEMECDTIAITRYLSFWSTLGSLVVDDDDDEADIEGSKGIYDLGNSPSHSHITNVAQATSDKNKHNAFVTSALQDAKNRYLRLFVVPDVASLLLRHFSFAATSPSMASSIWCTKAMAALEEVHKRVLATRQVGLRRKIRGILSPSVSKKSRKLMETEVSLALEQYDEETQALQWCQRMECRYCTVTLGPLLLQPSVSEEISGTAMSSGKTAKPLEGTARVTTEALATPSEATVQSVSEGGILHSILGPCDKLRRLAEVETLRRLLIKVAAAQSMESALASSLIDSRKCLVQLAQIHINEERESLHRDKATRDHLKSFHVSTTECFTGALDSMFEAFQEKVEYFVSAAILLFESNGLGADALPEVHRVESVPEQMYTVPLHPVVHKDTHIQETQNGPEKCVSHVLHDSKHIHLSSTSASECVRPSHSSQLIENSLSTHLVDGNSLTTATSDVHNDPLRKCAVEGCLKDKKVPFSESSVSSCSAEDRGTTSLEHAPQNPMEEKTNVEATSAFAQGALLSFAWRPHRLRRAGAAAAQSPAYRQLLSTGSGTPAMATHRRKAGDRLPALSFSDITREQEQWRGAEDLDEYRGMLAYRLYLVGPARCGKSSLAHCFADVPAGSGELPEVEPHTMRTRHSAARILEVNLQKNALPLGGYDASKVDMQRLNDPMWASESEPCRVGVDIVEVPTPMLHASSLGHVKLPARAAVYCVLYRAQDEFEATVAVIWQYVRMLQSALARPSPHVLQWMDSSPVDVPLPILLIGTHSDTLTDSDSLSDAECVAQERLYRLSVWFEEQVRQQAGTTEAAGWPRPLLLGSYMTSAAHWTVVGQRASSAKSFRALLDSTVQFMHLTAPLSPPHVLARWLPQHLRTLIYKDENKTKEDEEKPLSDEKQLAGTVESFWRNFYDERDLKKDESVHETHTETGSTQGIHDEHDKHRTLQQWKRCNANGLLVLFTALQRLRTYASCSFDEQSLDNSVLYHLRFVATDSPDEPLSPVSHSENSLTSASHSLLCMRDIIVEALLEECRLRGVLLFLPILSCTTPPCLPQGSRMVTIGPHWVETLWAQTFAPRMVVHHVSALMASGAMHQGDALVAVLRQCERQLRITLPLAYFAALWPEVSSEAQSDGEEMRELFMQYFTEGHLTLALLQVLWRSPYGVLALKETNALMALAASGLLSLTEESTNLMNANTNLSLPSVISCVALRC